MFHSSISDSCFLSPQSADLFRWSWPPICHEERAEILKKLSSLQVGLWIAMAKADITQYQSLYKKLLVEKDNLGWREKEFNMKNDNLLAFLILELGICKWRYKNKLKKEIIANFRTFVSSFPQYMGIMQTQLREYKEASSYVQSLHDNVQSLTAILDRMVRALDELVSFVPK
ncbi:hypothetical protein L1987_15670 [Smallanthus sonchifolius]|uniref:Uncharacterized protein n=1 Tax=Smallanthus sonchifolius TaxID=185202 RepID=A0ACB9J8F0_9ASTR|nr:hypothetical protein L1987_15670 [Smallanthus sonchifolius]